MIEKLVIKLKGVRNEFDHFGYSGELFWGIVKSVLVDSKPCSFRDFMLLASNGYGCTIMEGFGYVLDAELDGGDVFDAVYILHGSEEVSLSLESYLILLGIACDLYTSDHESEKIFIDEKMSMVEARLNKIVCSLV